MSSQILSKVRAGVWKSDNGGVEGTEGAKGKQADLIEDEDEKEAKDEEFDEVITETGDRIVLTYAVLDERQALDHVRDAGAGASVLFVGTTRNEFQGKGVQRLEYTAYSSLVRKTMRKLILRQREQAKERLEPVVSVYLAHRLGSVDSAQASILVCVSSPHRKAAFAVCEEILEEVKRHVPIWKKEVYNGQHVGMSEWKANATKHWTTNEDNKANGLPTKQS